MHADVLAGRWAVDFEGKLARSPDDPQRIRVASVFELFSVCLLDCLFVLCLSANFLILLLILLLVFKNVMFLYSTPPSVYIYCLITFGVIVESW